ncbi:Protein NRT1/ PTR FAMILY 1.2 like [Actinidia chinensis var. chinensis]|uniref:Protein NRT1/ PTR FAMILY 1.2 like n=1 Tax=Actinidia chinensis var. chinensis TaxID=1590841 RepID=A0A2R6PHC6_ACTCC|nr:Protein NRT1/ PTR FAMILY 1.2 like [Actinidia chinensis var. chinensis]
MEMEMEEEKIDSYSESKTLLNFPPKPTKGGFRTLPLIIVNESLEKVASYGLMPNMIFYLIRDYHMGIASGSIVLSLWSATSNALGIFGALLSDSYLGRFRVIVLGSVSSFLGMALLWLTATIPHLKPPPCEQLKHSCNSPTASQLAVLFSSLGLISVGAGCIRPCSMAFGVDQLDSKENPNNERNLQSFINWYYASTGLSAVLALTIIVYIQDHWGWQVGFAVPAILMAFSTLVVLLGSSIYVKVKTSQSLFTGFVQVLVVAFRKRKISLPPSNYDDSCHQNCEMKLLSPSESLRWLNKACITKDPERDLNPDGSPSNPWVLCTVDQVNSVKAFLGVIPMWSTGIMFSICTNQLSFSTLQANTMNRHMTSNFEVPAGSFIVFMIVTAMAWVAFYDRILVPLLARYTGSPNGLSPKVRMGIGLLLACLATAMAAIIESIRRGRAIDEGLENDPSGVVKLSAMWLVPQYTLLGLAEAFNPPGQIEFYFSRFPKSMSSIPMALFALAMAMSSLLGSLLVNIVDGATTKGGKVSWLSSNLNKGHIDYYYWVITFLGLVNFVYFLICCRAYKHSKDDRISLSDKIDGESDYRE